MSTRGAIARPTPGGGWTGRYHHFDAYPTGLGAELVHLYRDTFDGDHELMARTLIDEHPAGWSTLINHGLNGERPFTVEHFARCGFQAFDDPMRGSFPQCHCHGARSETADALVCRCHRNDSSGCSPLFIEWAYVITARGLGVLTSYRLDTSPETEYLHRTVAFVAWSETPNWRGIERRAVEVEIPDLSA